MYYFLTSHGSSRRTSFAASESVTYGWPFVSTTQRGQSVMSDCATLMRPKRPGSTCTQQHTSGTSQLVLYIGNLLVASIAFILITNQPAWISDPDQFGKLPMNSVCGILETRLSGKIRDKRLRLEQTAIMAHPRQRWTF